MSSCIVIPGTLVPEWIVVHITKCINMTKLAIIMKADLGTVIHIFKMAELVIIM